MPLHLDPNKTALVLIDLQKGIVGLPVQPHAAVAVVQAGRSLADALREKGGTVVYVRVDLANMLPLIVDLTYGDPNAAPVPASASKLVPEAGFREGDLLITKRHWGAFGQTALETVLQERGVDPSVLGGIATNFGVESTARQAASLGFHVVIAEDACSSMETAAHKFSVEAILPRIARVRSSQEILDALA